MQLSLKDNLWLQINYAPVSSRSTFYNMWNYASAPITMYAGLMKRVRECKQRKAHRCNQRALFASDNGTDTRAIHRKYWPESEMCLLANTLCVCVYVSSWLSNQRAIKAASGTHANEPCPRSLESNIIESVGMWPVGRSRPPTFNNRYMYLGGDRPPQSVHQFTTWWPQPGAAKAIMQSARIQSHPACTLMGNNVCISKLPSCRAICPDCCGCMHVLTILSHCHYVNQ